MSRLVMPEGDRARLWGVVAEHRRRAGDDTRRPRPLVEWSGVAKCATHTRRPLRARRGR